MLSDKQVQRNCNKLKHWWHHSFTLRWQSYSVEAEMCPPCFEMENKNTKQKLLPGQMWQRKRNKDRLSISKRGRRKTSGINYWRVMQILAVFSDVHVILIFTSPSKTMKIVFLFSLKMIPCWIFRSTPSHQWWRLDRFCCQINILARLIFFLFSQTMIFFLSLKTHSTSI